MVRRGPRATRPSASRPTSDAGARRPTRTRGRRCGPRSSPLRQAGPRSRRPAIPNRATRLPPSSGHEAHRRRGWRSARTLRHHPTTRRPRSIRASRRARSSLLFDEALLLQPGLRDVLRILLVDGDELVHAVQLVLRELRADAVEQLLDRTVVLREEVVADDRRDVVGELQVLVVLEEDEALRDDGRVAREEQPEVDLLPVERRDRERTAGVERLEVLELDAVGALEADLAEVPRRAFGGAAQDQLALRAAGGDVGELLQVVLGLRVLRDDEPVLVGRLSRIQG